MKDVKIKTTSIPAKPRSKNYPAGAVITRTAGGITVNGGGGGGASVDIVKATDTKSFTDSNVLSSLRTLLEIRSRIIASSDTATELTDDNTLSSLRILKEIDAAIKEALKKIDDLYLSKVKADIAREPITFLKGLFVGDGLTFINESGDTELQSLVARMKVKAATLEVTGSANVGTLHSEGNISTGADIWAKGDTHTLNLLVQALAKTYDLNVEHVATLFQTIVKDYISSERFIPGLMGEGMKLYKAINGDWNLEIDNAVVRKAMTIFELIISKVRAVNGGLVISSANGRVKSVSETSGDPAYYVLGIEGDMMFVADDLVRCQIYTSGHVKYYWVPVASVNDNSILILKSVFPNGTVPAVGDDLVQMGNLTNPNRQGILYLTASEDGKPRISVLNGVNSTSLAGKNKVILGCLDGMTDTDFPADCQPSGYGLYAMNCFLKGIFILRNGKSIEQEFSNIATELAAIPGKIELAIRSMKVADVNLLYDSNHTLSANPYQMGAYKYDVHLVKGKSYTLTVCYKCADSDVIRAYNNPSFGWIGTLPKSEEETVYSQKITPVNDDGTYFYFYKFPQQETTQTYIRWAVITEGNIGVATWIPSLTETKVGIKNLCSFKRITDEGFTYASDYKEDGTMLIDAPVLHKESLLANKDMFGLTYSSDKRYYIFVDHFTPHETIPSGTRAVFFRVIYTDGSSYDISVFNDHIENNFLLSNKPISRIIGSYGTGVNVYMRIGVFETNVPVSWSPAPEDQLYQSVKYTDTQILAVDGKIELSVTTQLNKRVIGGANLCLKSGVCITGVENHFRINMSKYWRDLRGKKVTLSFDYEYSNLVLGRNSRIGLEEGVLKDGTSNYYYIGAWKYFDSTSLKAGTGRFVHTITVPNDIVNAQNIGIGFYIQVGDGTTMKICNPQIEIGDTATGWKPAPEDGVNSSIEYTKSQIDIVEKKIELKVSSTTYEEGISNAQRIARYLSTGRMLPEHSDVCFSKGLNNLKRYNNAGKEGVQIHRSSIAGVPNNTGYSCTINTNLSRGDTTPGAGGFYFGNQSRYGAMFLYKLVAAIPKGRILNFATNAIGDGGSSEWLTSNVGTDKWEEYYHLVKCGTSGTLSSTGFFYIDDKSNVEWHLAYATVYDVFGDNSQINKTTYETKITQLESSISLKASQTDLNNTTERVRQAEIKIEADRLQLTVVEGKADGAQSTANSANSLAGTANDKAEAADGRVTATQNGLVETGINITSRKIVLKADNLLFQNNAGQQTAAINASGKLSANVIEAAEVVAQAFSAQRITTGNLTVTDGAKIGAWNISGGSLVSASNSQAKILLNMSGNKFLRINEEGDSPTTSRTALMSIRNDNYSGLSIESYGSSGFALRCLANAGTANSIESYGSHIFAQRGGEKWNAPGMLCTGYVYQAGTVTNEWGNGCTLTSAQKIATGKYRIYHNLRHPQYAVLVQGLGGYGWVFGQVETQNNSYFEVLMLDANKGPRDCPFRVFVVGRNVW
ncbi:hypothetical protein ACIXKZ_11245 [Bacteroides fragilis]